MSTYNYLPTNVFQLKIPDLPNVSFYAQEVNLPSIGVPATEVPFPGTNNKISGNTVEFSPLTVTFIVDEEMANYEEVWKWVEGQRLNSANSEKYANYQVDASLHVMTANSTTNRIFTFEGLFPTRLEELQFRTTEATTTFLTCTAQFEFTNMKIVR